MLGALQICPGNTFLFLKGTKDSIEILLGIRAYQSADVQLLGNLLRDGLLGNFAGSQLSEIMGEEKAQELERLTYYDEGDRVNIAGVNLILSRKKDLSPQGLEKLVDTMQGQEYTCLIIASPVSFEALKARIRGFQNLYSCICFLSFLDLAWYVAIVCCFIGMSNNRTHDKTYKNCLIVNTFVLLGMIIAAAAWSSAFH